METSILDLPALLAPLRVESPTGKDLRKEEFANSLYHKIKDARALARTLERQQIQGLEISTKPDWSNIYQFGLQALSAETKDLEIAVWLIEALLRQHGFAGLHEGFKLARELIAHHWDNLYPMPDEDGIITRLAPLIGLNGEESEGTLIAPIALVPLTQGHSIGPFSLWQYQQALEIIKIADPEKRNQRLASGAVTLEMIAAAVAETPAGFFQTQLRELTCCVEEFTKLTQLLEEKAEKDAFPSSRILAQLNACIDCIKVIAREKVDISAQSVSSALSALAEPLNGAVKTDISTVTELEFGGVSKQAKQPTRDEILQTLAYAADFFRRTEPHSPVPYLLERAIKWSKTPLPHLLKELIRDEQALMHFCNLTGVKVEE